MNKRAGKMLRLMDRAVTEWHIPVVGREKGRVIKRLLAKHAPTRGIEIGSLFGYSAILIAGNMPRGGRLTCIENNPYLAKFCRSNAEHAGLKGRVKVVVGDGEVTMDCRDAPPQQAGSICFKHNRDERGYDQQRDAWCGGKRFHINI